MLIELVEVKKSLNGSYNVSKILLNPRHIVYIQEDFEMSQLLAEGKINLGFNKGVAFSKIKVNEKHRPLTITVVGSPEDIQSRLSKRQVLRG